MSSAAPVLVPTPTGYGTWESLNTACEKARQALSSARGWAPEMPWDPVLAPVSCLSLAAEGLSQTGRTALNSVRPRGWERFYVVDASSLAGWLCWDKWWKVTSSAVMREGNGRNCPNYHWLFSPFLLMLEYRVPHVLIYPRKWGGITVITVLNYLWVWFEKLAGNTFLEGQKQMSSEDRRHSFYLPNTYGF